MLLLQQTGNLLLRAVDDQLDLLQQGCVLASGVQLFGEFGYPLGEGFEVLVLCAGKERKRYGWLDDELH